MDNEILLKEQFEQISSEEASAILFDTHQVDSDELRMADQHLQEEEEQKKQNENQSETQTSFKNAINSNKASNKFISNIASREKRIRKQKSYDDDFVLFNLTSSSHSYYANGQSVNNKQQNANSSYTNSEYSLNQSLINNNYEYNEIKYHIGDLVWAKVGGHPWWPCMITSAPSNEALNECITHVKYIGTTRPKRMFYVQFFGTSIEHAWVPEGCLIEYGGIEAFKTYAQDQVDQAMTKSAKEKLAERFQLKVALSRRENWELAVKEADSAMKKSISERKLYLTKKYRNQNSENQVGSSHQANKTKSAPSEDKLLVDTAISNVHPPIKQEYEDVDFMLSVDNNNNKNCNQKNNQNSFDYSFGHSYSNVSNKAELGKIKCEQMDDLNIQHTYSMSEQKRANVRKQSKPRPIPTSQQELQLQQQRRKRTRSKMKNNHFFYGDLKGDLYEYEENESAFDSNNGNFSHANDADEHEDENEEGNDDEDDDNPDNYNDTSDENYSDVEGINKKKQRRTSAKVPLNQTSSTENEAQANTICLRQRSNQPILAQGVYPNQQLALSDQTPHEQSHSSFQASNLLVKRNRLKANDKNTNESIAALVNQIKESAIETNSFTSVGFKKSNANKANSTETYLIDRYKYAVRHIRQGLSVEEACNKYRISKGALLKCLSGGTAPRGKKTRLSESEENEIVEWLINNKDLKYNEAIHLVFEQVEKIFQEAQRPNPFNNGKPSMDWWYDFLSRHPQIMASKPEWLRRGKVNDQYIKDVQSGRLRCTKFRRALLSAIQYIRSLSDAAIVAVEAASSDTSSKSSAHHQMPLTNNFAHINQQKSGALGKITSSALNVNMLSDGTMNKSQHNLHHHNHHQQQQQQQSQQTSSQINAQMRKKTKPQIVVNVNSLVKENNLKYKVLSQPNAYSQQQQQQQQQQQTQSLQKQQKLSNATSTLRRLGKAGENKDGPSAATSTSSIVINDKTKFNSSSSHLRKKSSSTMAPSSQIPTKFSPSAIGVANKSLVMNRTLQITHKLNHETILQANNELLMNGKQMHELEKPFSHHLSNSCNNHGSNINMSMNSTNQQQLGDNEDAENEYSLNQDEFDLVSNLNDYENNLQNLMMNASTTSSAINAPLIKNNHMHQMNSNTHTSRSLNHNEHEDDDLDRLVACLVDQNDDEHSPINPFDIDINPGSSASHLQTTSTIASSVGSSTQSTSTHSIVNNHDLFSSIMDGALSGANTTLNQRNGFSSHMINSSLSIDERLFADSADNIENGLAFGKSKTQTMTSTATTNNFYHHSSHQTHRHHNPSNLLLIEDDDDEEIEEFMNANSNFLSVQSGLHEPESDNENNEYDDEDEEEDAQTHITTLHEFA